ncbi:hypothetical protein G8759_04050 [Spirosoma aureum]|uniref:Uncharacterized protein n=1 Tax=Spirosoma aureum TaxID=2692134 RepID=A0A6G9AHC7_9BACT|nr:hypothetical protein [Spirosoma aureum]QIP11861.1 hypothetical protein G8759_04050 [Spirosoma aureum]
MNIQSDLIPGIYNYCDAWCERCLFTSRCQSFQIQHETGLTNRPNAGDDLVQQLTEALNLTRKYVENLTRVQNLTDKDRPTNEQALALEEKAVRRIDNQGHVVSKLASNYLRTTGLWLDEEKGLLEQAGQQQIRDVELGLRTQEEAMPVLHSLKDAWEMIRWYRTLIPVKTQSALRALAEPTHDSQLTTYHLGKAKLVLVSIDRSLLAWQTIIQFFPEKTDDLLDLMALLSRLRRELETLLPDARAFQRPGLD